MMHRFFSTLVACTALSVGCTDDPTAADVSTCRQANAPQPKVGRKKYELPHGRQAHFYTIDIPCVDQIALVSSTTVTGDAHLLAAYQQRFAELLNAEIAQLLGNPWCGIESIAVLNARIIVYDRGSSAVPSGAYVVLSCPEQR